MDAVRFLKEKKRMCDSFDDYCTGCGIREKNLKMYCSTYIKKYPEQAVAIVEEWSEEHPQETRLTRLLKNYPNTLLTAEGIPDYPCTAHLGLMDIDDCIDDCVSCWNMPIEDEGGVNV